MILKLTTDKYRSSYTFEFEDQKVVVTEKAYKDGAPFLAYILSYKEAGFELAGLLSSGYHLEPAGS